MRERADDRREDERQFFLISKSSIMGDFWSKNSKLCMKAA